MEFRQQIEDTGRDVRLKSQSVDSNKEQPTDVINELQNGLRELEKRNLNFGNNNSPFMMNTVKYL